MLRRPCGLTASRPLTHSGLRQKVGCAWLRGVPRFAAFCTRVCSRSARLLETWPTNPLPSTIKTSRYLLTVEEQQDSHVACLAQCPPAGGKAVRPRPEVSPARRGGASFVMGRTP